MSVKNKFEDGARKLGWHIIINWRREKITIEIDLRKKDCF